MLTHGPHVSRYPYAMLMLLLNRELRDAMLSSDPSLRAHAPASATKLLDLVWQEMLAAAREHSPYGKGIQALIADIEQCPGRHWEREEMATRLNLSVSHMSQVFRKELGVSPHAFVVQQRMKQAIVQLNNTSNPIKAIAEEVGYESLHSFTRLFTRHVGVPPGQYRERAALALTPGTTLDPG